MSARPDRIPKWASDADPGDVVAPNVPTEEVGFSFRFAPPYQLLNWMHAIESEWTGHFAAHVSTFPTLQAATVTTGADPLQVGQTCLIDEDDSDGAPLTVADEHGLADDARVYGIAACAEGVVVATSVPTPPTANPDLDVAIIGRDGTLIRSLDSNLQRHTSGSPGVGVWTDGVIVLVGARLKVRCWDFATGAILWTSEGFTADDWNGTSGWTRHVSADTERVYTIEQTEVVALDRGTGAEVWRFDHEGLIGAIAADGEYVYLVGEEGAQDQTVRKIRASDGVGLIPAGGTVEDGLWNRNPAVSDARDAQCFTAICVDRDRVYVSRTTGTFDAREYHVDAYSVGTGEQLWTTQVLDAIGNQMRPIGMAVDQDHLWVATRNGLGWLVPPAHPERPPAIAQIDKATGKPGQQRLYPDRFAFRIASDGAALWVGDVGSADNLLRVRRGNRVRTWRRVDPTARLGVPLAQKLVPA